MTRCCGARNFPRTKVARRQDAELSWRARSTVWLAIFFCYPESSVAKAVLFWRTQLASKGDIATRSPARTP